MVVTHKMRTVEFSCFCTCLVIFMYDGHCGYYCKNSVAVCLSRVLSFFLWLTDNILVGSAWCCLYLLLSFYRGLGLVLSIKLGWPYSWGFAFPGLRWMPMLCSKVSLLCMTRHSMPQFCVISRISALKEFN